MGVFAIRPVLRTAAWIIAAIIVSLNVKLVFNEVTGWLSAAGDDAWLIWITVVPVCMAAFGLLLYITLRPIRTRAEEVKDKAPHGHATALGAIAGPVYKRIAVSIDFSSIDQLAIRSAVAQGGKDSAYCLLHVVESAGATVYGSDIADRESSVDLQELEGYAVQLRSQGYQVDTRIGYGNPKKRIPELTTAFGADLLVMGAHGHTWWKDLIFGTTVDAVRHKLKLPVFIVRKGDNT
jgi:manganese transport protein